MLTILQFDAASISVLDRLLAAGRLPMLAGLRERGTWHDLEAPATAFAAGAQHTLYSGVPLGEHGLFYPFQWSPHDQRVRFMGDFPAPPPIWERLGPHGTRTLAVDPYESRPPAEAPPGALVCGWQLHDRVVLQRWVVTDAENDRLERLFGTPEPVDEVFGQHTVDEMLGCGAACSARRVGSPTPRSCYLREQPIRPRVAHLLRRPRRRPPVLGPLAARPRRARRRHRRGAQHAPSTTSTPASTPRSGASLDALPAGTDVMVISPVGMDVEHEPRRHAARRC